MDSLVDSIPVKVLLIGSDENVFRLVRDALSGARKRTYRLEWAGACADGLKALRDGLRDGLYDAVLLEDCPEAQMFGQMVAGDCAYPMIVLTGQCSPEDGREGLDSSAALYLRKNDIPFLDYNIHYAIEQKQKETALRKKNADLAEANAALLRKPAVFQTAVIQESQQSDEEILARNESKFSASEAELHKSSEALRESERARREANDRFRTVWEIATDAMALSDPQGTVIDANPAYSRLYGYSLEEVINQNYSIIFPEAIRDYARQQYPISFASPTIPPQFDTTIQRKDGQQRMVESRIAFVVQDGQRKAMLSVIHDITERKQVEALLKERNQALEKAQADLINEHNRLIAVMEALPVGLCILDRKGKVIQANNSYEEIWGGPHLPVKSGGEYEAYQAWWVETGQRVLPEEWASTRALLNGETITGQYLQIQRFDGTRGFVLNSGAPTRDSQGEITGSAVAVMDITEWVQTEAALEESERIRREANDRFRVALASVPLFVYTCDRDLRYTWLYQLPRGFKEEEVLGKRDDEILTPEAAGELIAAKQQALDTGKGGVREVKVPLYGEDIYYILTTEPIQDTQGNISGLTCSAIDITSQKQLENEYRERAMLLEIQRRLAELREKERQVIARDIHDGPIQTLVGTLFNVQIAKEAVNDPVAQLEFAQIGLSLQNTVHELREVVNELRPPSLIRFGLGKTIKIYLEDLREKHPQLRIQAELADDGVQVPEATRLALFRICQEALNNVIRHANATQVWLCYTVAENTALLEVRDNGQGMPALNSLVDQTRSGHYGMAGMKERAEALGGTLTVTSAPGQGTTICVWVPIG